MKNLSVAAASLLFLAQLELLASAAQLTITHDVTGQPSRVEVRDLDNPQVVKRFFLSKGESKCLDITGLRCKISVFSKGNDRLMVEGEFSPSQSLDIRPSGSSWVLKRNYR